ncbi:MAG: undecaprenyl-phosphate galactose phosphotransferase WbaP [Thermodesulfovibrionales bacterium]|nr:undecaprenyl-phosphate galactose phosphotransferase WbaP [Thermodesulfovibrionales bacterium]
MFLILAINSNRGPLPTSTTQRDMLLWVIGVWFFLYYYEGCYTKRFSFWDEIKALWKIAFFSTVGVFVNVSLGKLSDNVPRSLIILMGFFALPVNPVIRINSQKFLRKFGLFKRRVIIVGTGDIGRLTLKALQREQNYGYHVVGFIEDGEGSGKRIEGIKAHKGIDRVDRYIKRSNISDVFVALPDIEREKMKELVKKVQFKVERIMFIPDLQSIPVIGTEVHHFFNEQILSFEIKNNLAKKYNILVKRLFDAISGALLIVVLFVPMLVLSLLIMLDSPGHPIFTQKRNGRYGKTFRLYKFRTMYTGADEKLNEVLQKDANARLEWDKYYKLKSDPRVTKIGKFLRETSLDELPQIFNVFKGEMSLVGPRPVTQEEIDIHYKENAAVCFNVPPGLTGLWQISGRNDASYDHRVNLDLWYVRNWNLWLDIVILLKTVRVVLRKEGAY